MARHRASINSCKQWSLNPYLRKSLQKKLEHQDRLTAQVMAILELAQVKLQALLRNPNVSPADPTLKPAADDFAMLRLVLLALLPQVGGLLLMVGRVHR
jgi:hypothetical protein